MTLEEAKEKTRGINAEVILGTSDGSIYINPDVKAIEKVAKKNKLEVFYLKGVEPAKTK